MTLEAVQLHRWSYQEFESLAEMDFFDGDRVELIDGEIFHMAPQSSRHATILSLAAEKLRTIYQVGYVVRTQLPLVLDDFTAPDPDIAVVTGTLLDYLNAHPVHAILVVEVADSSLRHDRERKRIRYASAQIPEYWVINLPENCLEVYRRPVHGDYRVSIVFDQTEAADLVTHPDLLVRVSELIPANNG
ncbi:MAG: Uma2 family endonuclease [Candidatus Contendobacter sp.]|nr:Uma2 family endonuclease [Candidatus Contendobacter sp.]